MDLEKKVFNTIVTSSMLASSIVGCSSAKNISNEQKNLESKLNTLTESELESTLLFEEEQCFVEEDFRMTQEDTENLDYEVTEEEIESIKNEIALQEVDESKEVNEEKEFDFSLLDIRKWNDFELDSVEKKEPGYVVDVDKPTSLYVFPLTNDEFLDRKREVEEIVLDNKISFEIAEIRELKGPNNEMVSIGLIANAYGVSGFGAVLLGARDSSGSEIEFAQRNRSIKNTTTYITLADNIYPNKIFNTLLASQYMSEKQDKEGPFREGEENSFIDLLRLLKHHGYKEGLMSNKAVVWGGGLCALATGMSALVHQDESNKIIEQWEHPIRYFQSPFSYSPYKVDATIETSDEETFDFRWIFADSKYLKIDANISLSGVSFNNTVANGIGGISDVNGIFSLSLTDTYPEDQSEILRSQVEEYEEFRKSQHQVSNYNKAEETIPLGSIENVTNSIYNREDITLFVDRIEQNETLQDIVAFAEAINSYEENQDIKLFEYLPTTDWYKGYLNNPLKDKETLEYAIRILSHQVKVEGQPLQCVSYVILLSILYPELNIQNVGGVAAKTANELIRDDLKNIEGTNSTGFGGLLISSKRIDVEEYRVADLFVIQNRRAGHIGLVIDKIKK